MRYVKSPLKSLVLLALSIPMTPFLVDILAFITIRVRDYMVLYRSYDDDSVVDKIERLLAVVRRATNQ